MKKTLALILAAVLAMGMLAGCGSASSETEEKTEEKTEESTDDAALAKDDLGIVYVGIDGAYPPYCFLNEDDAVDGFEVAVMNEIAAREGIEIECQITAWNSMFGQLDSGRIDTVAENITISDERKQTYDFSMSYITGSNAFIVRAGEEGSIKTDADLAGKKIGCASSGTAYDKLVELQNSGIDFEIVPYDSSTNAYDVSIGRIDASFMNPVAGIALSDASDLGLAVAEWEDPNPDLSGYVFARTERGALIRELFNEALVSMSEDGTLAKLSEEYLGVDISHVE